MVTVSHCPVVAYLHLQQPAEYSDVGVVTYEMENNMQIICKAAAAIG